MANQDVALGIAQGLSGLASSFLQTKEVFNRDRELRLREQDQNTERELLAQKRKEEVEQKGNVLGASTARLLLDAEDGYELSPDELGFLERGFFKGRPETEGMKLKGMVKRGTDFYPSFEVNGKTVESPQPLKEADLKKAYRMGLVKMDAKSINDHLTLVKAFKGEDPDVVSPKESMGVLKQQIDFLDQEIKNEEVRPGGDASQLKAKRGVVQKEWDRIAATQGGVGFKDQPASSETQEPSGPSKADLEKKLKTLLDIDKAYNLSDEQKTANSKDIMDTKKALFGLDKKGGKAATAEESDEDQQMTAYKEAISEYAKGGSIVNWKGIGTREKKALDDMWVGMGRTLADAPHRGGKGTGKTETAKAPEKSSAETPPQSGAKKAKDGNWYIQKEDGWYRVS